VGLVGGDEVDLDEGLRALLEAGEAEDREPDGDGAPDDGDERRPPGPPEP
jgi:hypothetical protein